MKILRLVLITSMLMSLAHLAKAQVKIGENPLDIGADRQFEIEQNDTLFVITDNLTMGRTRGRLAGTTLPQALMIKLLGYGIDQFYPDLVDGRLQHAIVSGTTMSNVFLGVTSNGEILETPLRLLLDVDASTAFISMYNELDTFGTVDLLALDSIFVTDNELVDSLNTIRTLINNSNNADNDTITGNEYIDTIMVLGDTLLRFVENDDERLGGENIQDVDLSPIINAQTFYKADGDLDESRTVDGQGFDLTFNNIDNFNITTTSGGVDIIADTTDIDGIVTLQDYGTNVSGSYTNVLGVDADGNVVDVRIDDILASEVDSTIYNNDGTLSGPRVLTGNSEDLTFTGLGEFTVSGTSSTSTTTGNTNINADSTFISEELVISSYGDDVIKGTVATILAVDANGNVIETTADEILASEVDSTIYNNDGTLSGPRVLTGNSEDLTFTGLGDYTVSATSSTSTTTGNTNINADSTFVSEELVISSYGDDVIKGTVATILAVDANGNVIETTADEILASEVDSTIYNNDGTLSGPRVLTGNSEDLTFTGLGDYTVSATSSTSTTTGNTNINADSTFVSEELVISSYGDDVIKGTVATILAVDANGNVIETTADEILATDSDSTIYTHDGTLTSERTMSMDGNSLFFIGNGTSSNDTVVITNNGRMAIGKGSVMQGTSTPNDIRLDVNGDILAIQIHSSSDRRFKKNINPVENALQKVLGIKGVTYDFRTDEFLNRNFPTTKQLGFIAQDIETQLPEVVKTNPDGYKAVDYAKVTALLVEAMKEQQELIDALQEKVELSASLNAELFKEIQTIKNSNQKISYHNVADED